jgi:hypothetical protein
MGITFNVSGDWKRTERFLKAMGDGDPFRGIENVAKRGVLALRNATPVDSGISAASWDYRVKKDRGGITIEWINTQTIDGSNVPIVILLQYGHGTGTGGYVQGYDFINPAIKPVFDEISDYVWKAVKSA